MGAFSLDHLNDTELRRGLFHWGSQERSSTAMFIAHIAEFDRRRLYVAEGYPSMFEYCVRELKLSEGGTYRRIRAARAAKQHPQILEMLSEGRLSLTVVVLLSPSLTPENCDELLRLTAFRSASEVERLLAERFPRPNVPTVMRPLGQGLPSPAAASHSASSQGDLMNVPTIGSETSKTLGSELTLTSVETPMISHFSEAPTRPALVEPVVPGRFALQTTVDREFRELLQEAQALLSHAVQPKDIGEILKRGLERLVRELRRRKYAEVMKPRTPQDLIEEPCSCP